MKKVLSIFIFAAASLCANAQTMSDVLKTLPDSITPLLTLNNRLDLVDYMEAKMKAEVKNKLGGTTVLKELTDTTAILALSEKSELRLELMKDNGESLVKATYTYRINGLESKKVVMFKP